MTMWLNPGGSKYKNPYSEKAKITKENLKYDDVTPSPEYERALLNPIKKQESINFSPTIPVPTLGKYNSIQPPSAPSNPSFLQRLGGGIKDYANNPRKLFSEIGVGLNAGISNMDAAKQNTAVARINAENPFLSKIGNEQLESIKRQQEFNEANPANSVPAIVGKELTQLPLWMAGQGVVGAIGKGIGKIAPSAIPLAQGVSSRVPGFIKGGALDAGAYGTTVAPVESLNQGDSFSEFLDREKNVPAIFLGGAAFRGIGAGASAGTSKVKDIIKPRGVPPAPFGPPRPTFSAQRRSGLGPLKTNDVLPLEQGLGLSSTIRRTGQSNPLDDIQGAYSRPSLGDIRSRDAVKYNLGIDKTPTPIKPIQPSERNAMQGDLQKLFNDLPNQGRYSFTTGEQRALAELQEGIQKAQNYIGHTDVLAGYKPGTTIEQAYADIAKNTGVNLPKLASNWDKSQTLKKSLTPNELRMGREAGVIPPLAPRKSWTDMVGQEVVEPPISPPKTNPLQWTNREGIPTKPAPIRPVSEQQTLKDVLASRGGPIKPPRPVEQGPIRPRESTVDIEVPAIRSNANSTSTIEIPRTRAMAAEIEGPGVASSSAARVEPIRPQAETPGTAESFRAKVDRSPKEGRSFSEITKDARTHFIDDLAPLEKAERAINSGKLASAENSFYKQARLYRGNPEQAAELVRSKLAPVIKSVEKQGNSVKDIGDYSLALHARDVNAKGIESGFTNSEIAATIQKYGTPEMEAARKELLKINNELLESLAEGGVIEKSLVTALKEKWPNYMSLSRAFNDEKVEFTSEISRALANASSPIQRLKGSKKDVIDPIESMIKNIYKTTSTVDRNKIASQLKGLAENDSSGQIVRRLAEGEEKSRLNTVYAMEGGKKVHYEVQPDVYKALMGLDKDSSNKFIKIFQKPASLLRAGATLTPEFSLRNPIRDIPAAYAVSNSGLNPIRDIPMALFDIFRSRKGGQTLYNQYLKDNAGYGNLISTDRKVLQDAMTDVLKEPTSKKFVNIISQKSTLRFLRAIADVSENATKLGEYRAALRSGASRPEAAYRARDIMDFGRGGASIRELNKISAFLNANIQGKSKIYRAIKEDPVGVTARAFKAITLPTIGAFLATKYLANDVQKQRIEDAPDWMTSTFWLIPIPNTDQVARIPKPFDLAPMFANLPERTLRYIADNDPEAFEGFTGETLASWSIPTMITGLIPMIEGMSNYSLFRQGPIIPQREAGLNYSDQYDINTTETAKFLAKGMNKITGGEGTFKNFSSPRIMDNSIKGLTAGLGTYATSMVDYIAETSGMVDKKLKPARNISDAPLAKAFLVSDKSGGKVMEKLYSEREKLTRDKNSLKLENPKAKFPEEKRLKKLNDVSSSISDISKEIRKIENDKSLNPLQKRDKINALIAKRNELPKKIMGK